MARSPGHRKWPDHKVAEEHVDKRMKVLVGNEQIAESTGVIRVDEDGHRPRFYFPRKDVRMDRLEQLDKTTSCPFKGEGHYFAIRAGDVSVNDAAWSYDEPYDEHRDLRDRIAFHDETPEITVEYA